ncbi:hypothetical protein BGW39_008550 [Mortierella sp. 14UC]|nr:hypothetical protein BGW39_008550 [Mortierella sp. 14UC]
MGVLPDAKVLYIGVSKSRADEGIGHRTDEGYKAVWEHLVRVIGTLLEAKKASKIFRLVLDAHQQQPMLQAQPGMSIQPTIEALLGCSVLLTSRLTELRIENIVASNQRALTIDVVLDSCPALRELAHVGRVLGTAEVNTDTVQVGLSKDHALWTRTADDRQLPLQMLTIKNLLVSQRFLNAMVSACPDLLKLELAAIYLGERTEGNTSPYISEPIRRIEFFHLIGRFCPKLEYIQVSIRGQLLGANEMNDFREVFAMTPLWAFDRNDFYNQGLQDFLLPRRQIVTVISQTSLRGLEIHPEWGYKGIHKALHAFLTSPRAATLVHLKILGANYPISYFKSGFQAPENAWMCTSLETLHLRSYHEYGSLSPDIQGPANQWLPRHFFIGLSGAFPKMKDLQIDYPNIDFSLEGGMCLLRRMSNLERLRIKSMREAQFTESDLAWLLPDPTPKQRLQNTDVLKNLQDQIRVCRGGGNSRAIPEKMVRGYMRRVRDQSIAGTMEQIADLLEEIQTQGVAGRCLPYLESLIVEQGGKWDVYRHASQQAHTRGVVKGMQGSLFFHLTVEAAPPKLGVGP